jgi:C4-dicarboxylate transporter, DctM subunit
MSPEIAGLIGIALLFLFFILKIPIGFAMGLAGIIGFILVIGWGPAISQLGTIPYKSASIYDLSVLPLFILMANLFFYSGGSSGMYEAAYKWMGKIQGSLALGTIAACAAFAAICGSSPATAATVGAVALPEMKKYKYDDSFACGAVAAGGTLGIMIPPSLIFVIYGVLTSQSIGKLLIAGIVPGILLTLLLMITVYIWVKRKPSIAPPAPGYSWKEKFKSITGVLPVGILFAVIILGILFGWFTPTEAAAIGCLVALIIVIIQRKLTWKNSKEMLMDTVKVTGMCYGILIGAWIFSYFLSISQVPMALANFVAGLPIPPLGIMIFILLILFVLGCFMDSMSVVILTMPILFPVVMTLGFDPIWFGVMVVLLVEMGLLTPPVGANCYIVAGISNGVPLTKVFKGIFPFLTAMIVCAVILTIFPQIATWLPGLMK